MPKGPGTYGSKKGRPPEKMAGGGDIPTYDAGGRTQSADVTAYYRVGREVQRELEQGMDEDDKTTAETLANMSIAIDPEKLFEGPKKEIKVEPKAEPKAEPKTDPMAFQRKKKKSPLLKPTTNVEKGREKYAKGKEGSDQMTVDKLVEKRKTLTKGTAAYRENQNKINRLLGVDVKHSATSDAKKKKSYSDKDMARVKSYMKKNWAMDDTINKAALAAYKKMNK